MLTIATEFPLQLTKRVTNGLISQRQQQHNYYISNYYFSHETVFQKTYLRFYPPFVFSTILNLFLYIQGRNF